MLSDQDVIDIIRRHLESKFPKDCLRCGRRFDSLADYLLGTSHVGEPISGDNPLRIAEPAKLIGSISYANCACGSTLAMSSVGINPFIMFRMLRWAGATMLRRRISVGELLCDLRARIDEQVLREYFDKDPVPVRSSRPPGRPGSIDPERAAVHGPGGAAAGSRPSASAHEDPPDQLT